MGVLQPLSEGSLPHDIYCHKRFCDKDTIHSANSEDDHLSDLMSSNEDDDNESIEELYYDSLPYDKSEEVREAEVHM